MVPTPAPCKSSNKIPKFDRNNCFTYPTGEAFGPQGRRLTNPQGCGTCPLTDSQTQRSDGFWRTPSFRTDTMQGVCIEICCASCSVAPTSTRHINIRCEGCILTAVRGPVPRQMSRWKARALQGLHLRKSWFDGYTETKEHFFKSAAFHTTTAYTTRCWDEWHHYIRHTLRGWWARKRELYESQVEQMNIPKGRKRGRPDDWRAQWAIKRPRTGGT